MPPRLKPSLLFALLLVLSLAAKLLSPGVGRPDDARLLSDLGARLRGQGFFVIRQTSDFWPLLAIRGRCRMRLGPADTARTMLSGYQDEARPARVLIVYRDGASDRPLPLRPLVERQIQTHAFAFGVVLARPATVAVAVSGPCPPPAPLLDQLSAWPTGSAEPDPA